MIQQNSNPEKPKDEYACFLYENGTGRAVLVYSKEEAESLLNSGFSDCPTKAKAIKPKASK